jgi:adenosylmethionine-8-amino-7-oxononanoate aminotransferase
MVGVSLSGHEQAALDYMMSDKADPLLYSELELFAANEAIRLNTEFMDWTDTDGHDVIKRFFQSKGFKRVKGDE